MKDIVQNLKEASHGAGHKEESGSTNDSINTIETILTVERYKRVLFLKRNNKLDTLNQLNDDWISTK